MSSLCTSPQIRAWSFNGKDRYGRDNTLHVARCLTCSWVAPASTHKPSVDRHAEQHRKTGWKS